MTAFPTLFRPTLPSSHQPRVQPIPQPIPEQVQPQHRRRNRQPRKHRQHRRTENEGPHITLHPPSVQLCRLGAKPDVGKPSPALAGMPSTNRMVLHDSQVRSR